MVDLRGIARTYGGVARGDSAQIPTPGHSRKDRGTTVTAKPDAPDGVLVHSHNGGDPLAIKDMLRRDGFLPERNAPSSRTLPARKPRVAGETAYEYYSEDGVCLYRKLRSVNAAGEKTFRWQHPDGKGGWSEKKGDAETVPYRLLDIISADHGAIIYMAEGENCADRLTEMGFVATSSKDLPDDLAPWLSDRTVVILPDCDNEGEKAANRAREAVLAAGAHPYIVRLPGLPDKGDIVDWDGTAEDLAAITQAAINETKSTGSTNDLPLQWFSEIEPQLQGLWLVKKLLPASGLALIYGHPGSGKSFFALDMAFHIALGWEWHGRRVKQGLVVYVGAEGLAGLRNRMVAFRAHHNLEGDMPFVLIPTPIDLQSPTADTDRLINAIAHAAELSGCEPALIVIDTLSKTFGGGKENTDDMATYVANCGRIAAEFDALVMPVHHRPKDAESTEPRGHSSLKGGVDTVILIEAGPTKKATVTKQKDGEIGKSILFSLVPITLGQDEDGDEVTSCIVQPSDIDLSVPADPIAKARASLSDNYKLVLRELEAALEYDGEAIPTEIPDEVIDRQFRTKVVAVEAWRTRALSVLGTGADTLPDSQAKTFNRAVSRLKILGIAGSWGEFAWLK